jgi:hypothetical protein
VSQRAVTADIATPDKLATLRPENGTLDVPTYTDLDARAKWFYQAQVESPAMFRRSPGAGSLYWLGTRDASGAYLDGGKSYRLVVPVLAGAGASTTMRRSTVASTRCVACRSRDRAEHCRPIRTLGVVRTHPFGQALNRL